MNKVSSGKNSQLLIILVLAVTLLFGFYYYLVIPKKDERASAERSVRSLNSEVAAAKEQIALIQDVNKPQTVDVYALRKKVPQTRAVDQLLLNIEQMEFVVGARIESISFNNYDSLVSTSPLQDPDQVAKEEEEKTEATNTNASTDAGTDASNTTTNAGADATNAAAANAEAAATEATPVSTISPDQLPAELKMLTLNINVEAPDYESLLRFILEVESLERVVRVDTISYSLPTEQDRLSADFSELVNSTIQVTTFYYEGEQ